MPNIRMRRFLFILTDEHLQTTVSPYTASAYPLFLGESLKY
jgi:hypothetical protein